MSSAESPSRRLFRGTDARELSLAAANPRVRKIQREIAERYEQLAAIPNDDPIGTFGFGATRREPTLTGTAGSAAARWQEGRAAAAASRSGCDWENEGGAPRYTSSAKTE